MEPLNFTVHDKWTLPAEHPELLVELEGLTFDQKGIVEYKTLTSADYFLGIALSSMSLLVAFDRTVDENEDYFTTFIQNNSIRAYGSQDGIHRNYPVMPIMKGNDKTRLFCISGPDIMDAYP
jgi:hypothetical protein